MNHEELVEALRRCDMKQGCFNANCRYSVGKYFCDMDKVHKDAAAAIEELQSILTEADKKQAYQHDYICELVAEKEELQAETERLKARLPKRGEWELIDGAEPMRWGCSRCKYMSWDTSNYCPRCGAKMTEVQE